MKSSLMSRRTLCGFLFAAVALVAALVPVGGQGNGKLAADLAHAIQNAKDGSRRVAVIVQTYGYPDADDLAAVYGLDGDLVDVYPNLDGFAASMRLDKIAKLAARSRVKWVSPDRDVRVNNGYTTVATSAVTAWSTYGFKGSGIGIAVLDSGVRKHDDLDKPDRLAAWKDLVTSGKTDFFDDNGHGTHVAAAAAGDGGFSIRGNYSVPFTGVAPEANLIGVKVVNSLGVGKVSDVIAGIDWCIANRAMRNIRVMALALGHPVFESFLTDPLCQAAERAWHAGIVVVVAAGNRGRSNPLNPDSPPAYATIDSPGNDPYVITVGATNTRQTMGVSDDVMASYSSHGPTDVDKILKPDLVAPGNRAISVIAVSSAFLPTYFPGNIVSPSSFGGSGAPQYFVLSGTSMSAGAVAGAAAILIQQDPKASPDTIKARLMVSANDRVYNRDGSRASIFIRGAGQLDLLAALGVTGKVTNGFAWSPVVTRGSRPGLFFLSTGAFGGRANSLWGNNALWADAEDIYGSNALWADAQVYDQNALWADSVFEQNALWADELVWDSNALWADSENTTDSLYTKIVGEN